MSTAEKLIISPSVEEAFKPFEHFCKAMLDAYALVDEEGRIIKANQLFSQLVEKKSKQVLKADSLDTLLRLFIKDQPLKIKEILATTKDPHRIDEVRGENDSRNDLNLIIGIYPFFKEHDGSSLGAFILIRDVTAEKNLQDVYKTTKTHSITDPLTELYTRRFFEDYLKSRQLKVREGDPMFLSESLSILMIDIDFFKKINDVHGHQAGDYVLKTMGAILRNKVRKTDVPCRYGGEEFLVILAADILGAKTVAEKLRLEVENMEFTFENTLIPVRISSGIASMNLLLEDFSDTLKRADAALYQSKKMGRNQVSFHNGSIIQPCPKSSVKSD